MVIPLLLAVNLSSVPMYSLDLVRVGSTGAELRYAVHIEGVPPFVPSHVQYQGPVPVVVDAVPVLQRLVVGAVVTVVKLAAPQVPLVDCVPVVTLMLSILKNVSEEVNQKLTGSDST
jgi:hypothetical protein